MLSDNWVEYTNEMFRHLVVKLVIHQEFTPAQGAKHNSIAERRLAFVADGGRTLP